MIVILIKLLLKQFDFLRSLVQILFFWYTRLINQTAEKDCSQRWERAHLGGQNHAAAITTWQQKFKAERKLFFWLFYKKSEADL